MIWSCQTIYVLGKLTGLLLACGYSALKNAIASWLDAYFGTTKQPEPGMISTFRRVITGGRNYAGSTGSGCAKPRSRRCPPTLNLPAVIFYRAPPATRVGDEVRLHWTTPALTTDKLSIKGPITAVICRETVTAPVKPTQNAGEQAAERRERIVPRLAASPVTPEALQDATDLLPATLTASACAAAGVPGRTAGTRRGRTAVAVNSGVRGGRAGSRRRFADFRGTQTKAGVELEWNRAEPGSAESFG